MNKDKTFNNENLDFYLKELAKEYRKTAGKYNEAEIIIVGGAAMIANYNFRESTNDIDALIRSSASVNEAVCRVRNKNNLPDDWMNSDFKNTSSYSPKLFQYSVPYKTFSNNVHFRTISSEYLVAMKLKSARQYKSDLSDVACIIKEHEERGTPLSYETICTAINNLYGDSGGISAEANKYLENVFASENLDQFIKQQKEKETRNRQVLVEFEKDYPNILSDNNIDTIIATLEQKSNETKKESVTNHMNERYDKAKDLTKNITDSSDISLDTFYKP